MRAWDDLAMYITTCIVDAHSHRRSDEPLGAVFEDRIDVYGAAWNACLDDGKTYPATKCLQLLRNYVISGARSHRIIKRPPFDVGGGLVSGMATTASLVELDVCVLGKLDCMLKHILQLPGDLSGQSEQAVLLAAARGADESDRVLGIADGRRTVQSQLAAAMQGHPAGGARRPEQAAKRWWEFWR